MKVNIVDKMWSYRRKLISDKVVAHQWKALNDLIPEAEPSHAIINFEIAAGVKEGKYYGQVFQDSDVYKWLEMAIYTLKYNFNDEVLQNIDYLITLIEKAQESSGYLNTYYQLVAPEKKWTNLRDHHELYCAGHLIEAAVALKEVLDDDRLMVVSERFVQLIHDKFNENNLKGYPGHQEIEIGLLRAYEITKNKLYFDVADFFIKERGKEPYYFMEEAIGRDPKDLVWNDEENINFGLSHKYQQSHDTFENQTEAVGHAVRAVYYYASAARLLQHEADDNMYKALKTIWEDIIKRKMYVTGAIGANVNGESFGEAYDLPNDVMYCETCASVGLTFLANEISKLEVDSVYAETIERVIYNSLLSGINIEGDKFFYVNPLEVNMDTASDLRYSHVHTTRQKWLEVACCPPNLGRLIASIDRYIYKKIDNNIYVEQFIGSELEVDQTSGLKMDVNFGENFEVNIEMNNLENITKLHIRKPEWLEDFELTIDGEKAEYTVESGYLVLDTKGNSKIKLESVLKVKEVYSNPKVLQNQNKVAFSFGPYVYCLEQEDNESNIFQVVVPEEVEFKLTREEMVIDTTSIEYDLIEFDAYELVGQEELYTFNKPKLKKTSCKAIPYYLWANRNEGNMLVWLNKNHNYTTKGEENEEIN